MRCGNILNTYRQATSNFKPKPVHSYSSVDKFDCPKVKPVGMFRYLHPDRENNHYTITFMLGGCL